MRRTLVPSALLLVCACGSFEASQATFPATVAYDTVAVVGGESELRPLFLYANPTPYLLDSITVAYADEGGRIVVANLLTGEGWETGSSRGEGGPGEFDGREVMLSPFGGVLHAVGRNWSYASWTAAGELIASGRTNPPYTVGREFGWLQGIVDGRLVVFYRGVAMRLESGVDTLPQGIRIQDLKTGHIVESREGIPDLIERVTVGNGSSVFEDLGGAGVIVTARGRTIARATQGGRLITLLDSSGKTIASRELDADLTYIRIDADGRIWARVRDGSMVFNEDLSAELFRVAGPDVTDAYGDYLLTTGEGKLKTTTLVLLKMRPREG